MAERNSIRCRVSASPRLKLWCGLESLEFLTRRRGDAEVCRGRFLAVGLVAWSSTIVVERLSAADVAGKDGLFEWGGRTGKSAHPTGLCFDVGQRTIWIWMTWSNRMRTGRPEKSALVRALA